MLETEKAVSEFNARLGRAIQEQVVMLVKALKQPETPGIDLVSQIKEQVLADLLPARSALGKRRYWTVEQKQRILMEAAAAKHGRRGDVQIICDKYRITSAHLTQWKHQLTE